MPTKIAPMPPAVATELSPERPFRSARCRFTIISIPTIQKPRHKLIRLTPVEIFCSVRPLRNPAGLSAVSSVPGVNPSLKL
jgi:hypothetical protein